MSQSFETYKLVLELLLPAVIAGFAMAVAGASLGTVMLLRREALLSLALPQVVILGSALGLRYLHLDAEPASPMWRWVVEHSGWPTLPAAVAAVLASLLLVSLSRARQPERAGATLASTLVLPSIYIGAVAVAVLIVSGAGSHLEDVKTFFVGNPVAVERHLAEVSTAVMVVCSLLAVVLWRRWLLIAQSPAAAQLAGLRPARWDALFLALLSAVILVGTNALGAVMVISLLFLPAATVLPWARRVPGAIAASILLSLLVYAGGFVLSVEMEWPLSHSVGGLGFAMFLLSYLVSRVLG